MYLKKIFFLTTVFLPVVMFAQSNLSLDNIQLKPNTYDYSDQFSATIQVKVWGVLSTSGIFKINKGTRLIELLSFAGGLKEDVEIDEIRIIRAKDTVNYNNNEIIKINYEDMFEADNLKNTTVNNLELRDGDIIITTRETNWYANILPITSMVSLIASLVTIYIVLKNK